MTDVGTTAQSEKDFLGKLAHEMLGGGEFRLEEFRHQWIDSLYKVGVIGIKTDAATSIRWNYKGRQTLFASDINEQSSLYIHPMLWRRFGVIKDEEETLIDD